jgi:dihydroorotate dehydrogenase
MARTLGWGSKGRGFKSLHPDKSKLNNSSGWEGKIGVSLDKIICTISYTETIKLFSLGNRAELAHGARLKLLETFGRSRMGQIFIRILGGDEPDPILGTDITIGGQVIHLKHPIGIGAGYDKDMRILGPLGLLNNSFVEGGTVTPYPQEGNAQPRFFLAKKNEAKGGGYVSLNSMGTPSIGTRRVAQNLRRYYEHNPNSSMRVGVSIGLGAATPSRAPHLIPNEIFEVARELGSFADYLAINASSPNTHNLRTEMDESRVGECIDAVRDGAVHGSMGNIFADRLPPVFVKISPDITPAQMNRLLRVASDKNTGLIIANTTTDRKSRGENFTGAPDSGGVGGDVDNYRNRVRGLVERVYRETSGEIPIIGVGGIVSEWSAMDMIKAGASAVQIVTAAFGYGPTKPIKIAREVAIRMKEEGFSNVNEMVGYDAHKWST